LRTRGTTLAGWLLVASLGCRRNPTPVVSAAARVGVTAAPKSPIVLTADEPQATLVTSQPAVLTSAQGALLAPDSGAPGSATVAGSAVPLPGPSGEAVAAALASLTEEGKAAAPNPATLPFYDFEVTVDPVNGDLRGRERIDYPNRFDRPLERLPLRVFANAGEARVVVDGAAPSAGDPSLLQVALLAPVPPGGWARVDLSFHGRVSAERDEPELAAPEALLAGPERDEDYGLFSRFHRGVALAEWLPMVAARWHGDFDRGVPSGIGDSSFFDLSSFRGVVDLPADYRVALPGVILGEEPSGARRRTTFALADARDVALFASRDYRSADASEGGVTFRSYYQNGRGEAGQAVLQTARAALACFVRNFGPYPYRNFVAAEVPLRGGAGGAEFPGLIAVGGFLYGEPGELPQGLVFTRAYLGSLLEFTVAHEVAHQWWALQVASHPRDQPDVDEPLAQFSAAYYLGQRRGVAAMGEAMSNLVAVNYQSMRLLGASDGPAARSTAEFLNTAQYAGIIYGKAPFFFSKVAETSSQQALTRGLAGYFRAHRFAVADREDLVTALSAAGAGSAEQLQRLRRRWFEDRKGDEDLAGLGDPLKTALGALEGEDVDLAALFKAVPQISEKKTVGDDAPSLLDPEQTAKLLRELNRTFGGLAPEAQ
jgi:hypothetical protein